MSRTDSDLSIFRTCRKLVILQHCRQVISSDSTRGPIELVPQGMEFNRSGITAEHVLAKTQPLCEKNAAG